MTPKPKIRFPQKLMQFPHSQFSHQSRCMIIDLTIINAKNAIIFASFEMKYYYDSKHQTKFYKIDDFINFCLHRGYQLPIIKHPNIKIQFAEFFKITECIGRLIYRSKFLDNMKIHNVIFFAHIKFATDPGNDPYHRHRTFPPAVIIDNQKNRKSKN